MNNRLSGILSRLQDTTAGCQPDMRDPDQQQVYARVVGYTFNNSDGEAFNATALRLGYQEIVVFLSRDTPSGLAVECFNLCDLIALARRVS